MRHLVKKRNFWIILCIDLLLLCLAYFLSYFIRFEGKIPAEEIAIYQKYSLAHHPVQAFSLF